MARARLDVLSQRELVNELRVLFDAIICDVPVLPGCPAKRCQRAIDSIAQLALDNPRSIWSTKVLHNLGAWRTRLLLRIAIPPPERAESAFARAGLPNRYEPLVTRRAS